MVSERLRPLGVGCSAEYPAAHVLCFDDEYAEFGDDDVIDLCCPVLRRQGHIMQLMVCFCVEILGG